MLAAQRPICMRYFQTEVCWIMVQPLSLFKQSYLKNHHPHRLVSKSSIIQCERHYHQNRLICCHGSAASLHCDLDFSCARQYYDHDFRAFAPTLSGPGPSSLLAACDVIRSLCRRASPLELRRRYRDRGRSGLQLGLLQLHR